MIEIDQTLISSEIIEKKFVCDLNACKGACCVEGDSGAPLEHREAPILEEIFDKIIPYLRPEGLKAIKKQGAHIIDAYGELTTPLVEGAECAYAYFEKDGTAKCGIEKAFNDGVIDFPKPVSCHLYPIRIIPYNGYEALNYHRWEVCKPACDCGDRLKVPVYRFVKNALLRKYGKDWYTKLELAAEYLENEEEK